MKDLNEEKDGETYKGTNGGMDEGVDTGNEKGIKRTKSPSRIHINK